MTIIHADCLDYLRQQPDNSIDLIFGSPPYEAARTYGIGFCLRGQEWVDWMVERWREMDRVCRGLVAMVVEGQTKAFRWSATPALLMADLHRAGFRLRKPPLYVRHGVSGSGGPDWLKNRFEFVVCTSKGRLPWSDNTACGHPPKCKPGGAPSNRTRSGARTGRDPKIDELAKRENISAREAARRIGFEFGSGTSGMAGGDITTRRTYIPPKIANPGNLIDCGANTHFGIGNENEAPFPEKLAEFFIKSFCPPVGTVYDPFCGSGTTLAVASRLGRQFVGTDIRPCQVELSGRRIEQCAVSLAAAPDKADASDTRAAPTIAV